MYSLAMQLKQMTDSLATSITQTRRSMQMDILPDAGKVDFVNTEWNTKWVQYQAAKEKGDKELMTLIGQGLVDLANEAWSLPGIDKVATFDRLDPILAIIEQDARDNSQALTDMINDVIIPQLEAFGEAVDTKLTAAIEAAASAIDAFAAKLAGIDWSPLGGEAPPAPKTVPPEAVPTKTPTETVPPEVNVVVTPPEDWTSDEAWWGPKRSHQSGLDFVPTDKYYAELHKGEAVLTSYGNKALAGILSQLSKMETGGSGRPDILNSIKIDMQTTGIEDKLDELINIWKGNQTNITTIYTSITNALNTINSPETQRIIAGGPSAIPSHQSGLDYVPTDNYIANLHKGEAVITNQGNKALTAILNKLVNMDTGGTGQPPTVFIQITENAAALVNLVEASTYNTIRTIKRNPDLIRRT
jgi:hypothetical protein